MTLLTWFLFFSSTSGYELHITILIMSLFLIGTMAVFGFRWYYPAKESKYSMFYQIRDGYFTEWYTERKINVHEKAIPNRT